QRDLRSFPTRRSSDLGIARAFFLADSARREAGPSEAEVSTRDRDPSIGRERARETRGVCLTRRGNEGKGRPCDGHRKERRQGPPARRARRRVREASRRAWTSWKGR